MVSQLCNLDKAVKQVGNLARLLATSQPASEQVTTALEQMTNAVNRSCLKLCVSLLKVVIERTNVNKVNCSFIQ